MKAADELKDKTTAPNQLWQLSRSIAGRVRSRMFGFDFRQVQPLRGAAEKRGSGDFSPLWAGEAAAFAREESAETLTRLLWADAVEVMSRLSLRTD